MNTELKRYTSWFVLIGILSIINSVVWWLDIAELYFVVGLGITQFVDGFIYALLSESGIIIALLINIVISGFFILTTVLANKGHKIIYYVAIVLYIIDLLILLLYKDFMSVGFHAFALFFIFKGAKIIKNYDVNITKGIIEDDLATLINN